MYLGRIGVLQTEHDLPAAEGLVGCSKIGGGGTAILACLGHFQRMCWPQDFV